MTEIVSVYAVFADAEEAGRIARILIEERLAACANILGPCRSIYRWRGKVEEAVEVPAIFKTRADAAAALVARVATLNSYDVPCVVVWPIADALADYARWVAEETPG
jgi:periplasmic divalent cation tolerance protein